MIVGITVQTETDKETGRKKGMTVTEHKEDLAPAGRHPRRQV